MYSCKVILQSCSFMLLGLLDISWNRLGKMWQNASRDDKSPRKKKAVDLNKVQ